jgi:hypothetical protein
MTEAERRACELGQAMEDLSGLLDDPEDGPPFRTILEELGTLQGEVTNLQKRIDRALVFIDSPVVMGILRGDGETP